MHSSTMTKFIGSRGQDPFGYRRVTKTHSSSTKEPANDIGKTIFLESHPKLGYGASLMIRLLRQLSTTSRIYSPPPTRQTLVGY